jgi:hypothetical protein
VVSGYVCRHAACTIRLVMISSSARADAMYEFSYTHTGTSTRNIVHTTHAENMTISSSGNKKFSCAHVYIYIYIYIHTHTHNNNVKLQKRLILV